MTTLLDSPTPSERAPETPPSKANVRAGRLVTGILMISPPIALAIAVPLLWGHAINLLDVVLAATIRCFFSKTLDALGVQPDAEFAQLDPAFREALTVGRPIEEG